LGHSSRRKRAADPLFELRLNLEPAGSRDSSRTLYRELKLAILDGRLSAGTKLPATRQSIALFGVSRNTATAVYERLVTEGYAHTRHGAGTYVAATPIPARPAVDISPAQEPLKRRLNGFWLRPDVAAAMSFWRDAPDAAPSARRAASVDFRPAMVDSRLFPMDVFRRVSVKQLRALEKRPPSQSNRQTHCHHAGGSMPARGDTRDLRRAAGFRSFGPRTRHTR
jgi:GntR family transcriptional regulator/MocR family aminotransferase